MSRKKSHVVLGYTRAGHEVLLPTHQTPDMSRFVSWTPGDHLDASRILMEHGERESDPLGSWCSYWAGAHRAIGKGARKPRKRRIGVIGGAEVVIRGGRGKRP